jgi:glucokinase
MDSGDCEWLQAGRLVEHAPKAIIGAGTGLGQCWLAWTNNRYVPMPTEGGHVDFGPTSDLEFSLARYLFEHCGHASYELVLSGPGLLRLYQFLCETGAEKESDSIRQALTTTDPAAVITDAALRDHDALCVQTLHLFIRIYGAQAGNLALTAGARAGVYVAGGIAPKILAPLRNGIFMEAFNNKANMSEYVKQIPVAVITKKNVGLFGCEKFAESQWSKAD